MPWALSIFANLASRLLGHTTTRNFLIKNSCLVSFFWLLYARCSVFQFFFGRPCSSHEDSLQPPFLDRHQDEKLFSLNNRIIALESNHRGLFRPTSDLIYEARKSSRVSKKGLNSFRASYGCNLARETYPASPIDRRLTTLVFEIFQWTTPSLHLQLVLKGRSHVCEQGGSVIETTKLIEKVKE